MADEAFVDECSESIEDGAVGAAQCFRGCKRASCEDAELCEEALSVPIEKVVAPVERRAQGLLVLRCVAVPAREELEAVSESREQCRRR